MICFGLSFNYEGPFNFRRDAARDCSNVFPMESRRRSLRGVGYPLSVNGETLSRFGGPCAVAILVDDLRMKIDHARVVALPPLLMLVCLSAGFLAEHFQHFPIFPANHHIRRPLCFALFRAAAIIFVAAIRELI